MAMLEILIHPDPVLRQRARLVRKFNRAIKNLASDLAETMYAAPNGVGLAATQVGILRRVLVADVGHGLHVLVNPQIVRRSGEDVAYEGCLSIPGKVGEVRRSTIVEVRYHDLEGRDAWLQAEGALARCLQHEIDHLDGVLFLDRALSVEDVAETKSGEGVSE